MTLFGPDPIETEVQHLLQRLATGVTPRERLESRHVDLKEEAGRRQGPRILPPVREDEATAKALAGEAVCMANTERGGVLVVGVSDDGTLIGTGLDGEWLRRRIYDLTQQKLTVTVVEAEVNGHRLLLVRSPEAIHPIAWNNKFRHRVDDGCVEIDASTWENLRRTRSGYDWSALPSDLGVEAVRASAVQRARDFLVAAGDEHSGELAAARDADLLRRLNVLTADGRLTNAGVIAFVGRGVPAIDYVRREVAGGDSVQRLRQAGVGLLEELYDVDSAMAAANPLRHITIGLVNRQVPVLPRRAVREALVNGVAHRDWASPDPTHVEHIGGRLVVTSPGGFIGGVTPHNIITHPSQPRNRALAELLAAVHVAEREGIGVDRMVGDMIRLGYQPPNIDEIPGPFVRAVLLGSSVDTAWMAFLSDLRPEKAGSDLDSLLLLRHLIQTWWVDADTAAPLLQRSTVEAADAINELSKVTAAGHAIIEPVQGVPSSGTSAWQVTAEALAVLARHDDEAGTTRSSPTRAQIAQSYVAARGRISSTELGSIVGAHPTNLQRLLRELEQEGVLAPGRENRRGAGFYYVRANPGNPANSVED